MEKIGLRRVPVDAGLRANLRSMKDASAHPFYGYLNRDTLWPATRAIRTFVEALQLLASGEICAGCSETSWKRVPTEPERKRLFTLLVAAQKQPNRALSANLRSIFNCDVKTAPDCQATQTYLLRVRAGMSSPHEHFRAATVLAVELHADGMFRAFHERLAHLFHMNPEDALFPSLSLARPHVRWSDEVCPDGFGEDKLEEFLSVFDRYYRVSLKWARQAAAPCD